MTRVRIQAFGRSDTATQKSENTTQPMVGPTLVEVRDHIETLASGGGEYYVVCECTGDRPVPADGKRFDDRATARNAARATEQYRSALRQYDPQVPYYDLIVYQNTDSITESGHIRQTDTGCPSRNALRANSRQLVDDRRAAGPRRVLSPGRRGRLRDPLGGRPRCHRTRGNGRVLRVGRNGR